MPWLMLVVLASGAVVTQRFPNRESCDSARIWLTQNADVRQSACHEDIADTGVEPAKTDGSQEPAQ